MDEVYKRGYEIAVWAFFTTPCQHSEDAADHAMAVEVLEFAKKKHPPPGADADHVAMLCGMVASHKAVIDRFGRWVPRRVQGPSGVARHRCVWRGWRHRLSAAPWLCGRTVWPHAPVWLMSKVLWPGTHTGTTQWAARTPPRSRRGSTTTTTSRRLPSRRCRRPRPSSDERRAARPQCWWCQHGRS
jgi:hypothetical protein